MDWSSIAKQIWLPLTAVAADKSVKIFETRARWPMIKGPNLCGHPVGYIVFLAKPGCGIAVLSQYLADCGCVFANQRVVAWIAGGHLRDDAKVHGVVVAAGNER